MAKIFITVEDTADGKVCVVSDPKVSVMMSKFADKSKGITRAEEYALTMAASVMPRPPTVLDKKPSFLKRIMNAKQTS